MSTTTASVRDTRVGQYLLGGIGGGLAAGVAMGVILTISGIETMQLIGGMYGFPSVLAGWVAHLFNSVVFGLIFVAAARTALLRDFADTTGEWIAVGVVYGALLEVVSTGVVLPTAISVGGLEQVPFPPLTESIAGAVTVAILVAVAHLVYGAVLGGVYAVVHEDAEEGV